MFKLLSRDKLIFIQNKNGNFKLDKEGKKIPETIQDVNGREFNVYDSDF